MSENIIKASELRIGNLVIDIETGKEYVIKPIDIYNAAISVKPLFAGIKLAKERLAEARFFDEKYEHFQIEIIRLEDDCATLRATKIDKGFLLTLVENQYGNRMGINLGVFYYVHQLQNLCSDLTGEELPIS